MCLSFPSGRFVHEVAIKISYTRFKGRDKALSFSKKVFFQHFFLETSSHYFCIVRYFKFSIACRAHLILFKVCLRQYSSKQSYLKSPVFWLLYWYLYYSLILLIWILLKIRWICSNKRDNNILFTPLLNWFIIRWIYSRNKLVHLTNHKEYIVELWLLCSILDTKITMFYCEKLLLTMTLCVGMDAWKSTSHFSPTLTLVSIKRKWGKI